ncbi:MAG: membrane dipeptidase, partial [Chlamydiae bacterium]|nr:membrane dipeptidase [Chlamydiota bacterium]
MHTFPIVDLHADLLCYLEKDPKRTPFDLESRCSIPQLKKGNVIWQTLPIFTHTNKGSSLSTIRQINCFKELKIQKDLNFLVSIENGSAFFEEEEPLSLGLKRAQDFLSWITPLYISLTWKFENRLGGGNMTNIGLKKDGEVFLEFLQDKNIAIDLSHTSDKLAFDILNYLN